MTRMILLTILVATLPPTYNVDDDYTAVRKDVLAQMNLADINLPLCEARLEKAQEDLQAAEANIAELRETVLRPTYGQQFSRGWEQVDGPLGLTTGYVLGTAQCLGMAWVFNQPEFRR